MTQTEATVAVALAVLNSAQVVLLAWIAGRGRRRRAEDRLSSRR